MATPSRRPVKPPGPIPTQMRATSSQPIAGLLERLLEQRLQRLGVARALARARDRRGARPRARPPTSTATGWRRSRVDADDRGSRGRSRSGARRRRRARAGRGARRAGRPGVRGVLGPLDERDRVVGEERVEQPGVLAAHPGEPVEVEVRERAARPSCRWPTTNVGDVTGPSTPRLRSAPRTNVVLPAPSSPETSTTSPGRSARRELRAGALGGLGSARSAQSGSRRRARSVEAGAEQEHAAERERPGVDAGVRQRRAGRAAPPWPRRPRAVPASRRGWAGAGVGRRPRARGGAGVGVACSSSAPNGSEYWSSPAPCAKAPAAGEHERRDGGGEPVPESRTERHERASVERRDRLRSCARWRHILLLTDRDWTHPQGGGTGANLYGQVAHWLAWGHRVTVVAGTYPGAERGRAARRRGSSCTAWARGTTVFPRAAWAVRRGLARDADVVLEVVNGITFLTPLWLRTAARDARAPRPPRPLRHRARAQGRGRRAAGRDAAAEAALRAARRS